MVNAQLLDEKIEKSGYKLNYICEKIGISRSGFNLKEKNEEE